MSDRIVKCPFCGTKHATRPWLNVLCPCGAKYYVRDREWWDRVTGKIVKEEK